MSLGSLQEGFQGRFCVQELESGWSSSREHYVPRAVGAIAYRGRHQRKRETEEKDSTFWSPTM